MIFLLPAIIIIPVLIAAWYLRFLLFYEVGELNARTIIIEGVTKEFLDYFVKCINRIPHGSVFNIVAGEANAKVYTDAISEAMKEAVIKRGIKIRFICGPKLSVKMKDGKSKSEIAELFKEGLIELYRSSKRQNIHFRSSTDGRSYWHVYWEEHDLGADERIGYDFPQNRFEEDKYSKRFNRLISSGKVKKISPTSDPYSIFNLEVVK